MRQKLYLMLGDVVSSRRIVERDTFREMIEKACSEVNSRYSGDIHSDFKVLKGIDEIGGVLLDISNVYEIVTLILKRLHPELMRFALVYDYVDTGLETTDVARMDGPAFHIASNSINRLKKENLMFDMSVEDELVDMAISGEINLIILLKGTWSDRQYRAIHQYEKDKNQSQVAKKLGITQQAVSKALNRSMWKEIKEIENGLGYIFAGYQQKLHVEGRTT